MMLNLNKNYLRKYFTLKAQMFIHLTIVLGNLINIELVIISVFN